MLPSLEFVRARLARWYTANSFGVSDGRLVKVPAANRKFPVAGVSERDKSDGAAMMAAFESEDFLSIQRDFTRAQFAAYSAVAEMNNFWGTAQWQWRGVLQNCVEYRSAMRTVDGDSTIVPPEGLTAFLTTLRPESHNMTYTTPRVYKQGHAVSAHMTRHRELELDGTANLVGTIRVQVMDPARIVDSCSAGLVLRSTERGMAAILLPSWHDLPSHTQHVLWCDTDLLLQTNKPLHCGSERASLRGGYVAGGSKLDRDTRTLQPYSLRHLEGELTHRDPVKAAAARARLNRVLEANERVRALCPLECTARLPVSVSPIHVLPPCVCLQIAAIFREEIWRLRVLPYMAVEFIPLLKYLDQRGIRLWQACVHSSYAIGDAFWPVSHCDKDSAFTVLVKLVVGPSGYNPPGGDFGHPMHGYVVRLRPGSIYCYDPSQYHAATEMDLTVPGVGVRMIAFYMKSAVVQAACTSLCYIGRVTQEEGKDVPDVARSGKRKRGKRGGSKS